MRGVPRVVRLTILLAAALCPTPAALRKPAIFEAPLIEGKTGIFTLRPVSRQGRYLGMVYIIRLK